MALLLWALRGAWHVGEALGALGFCSLARCLRASAAGERAPIGSAQEKHTSWTLPWRCRATSPQYRWRRCCATSETRSARWVPGESERIAGLAFGPLPGTEQHGVAYGVLVDFVIDSDHASPTRDDGGASWHQHGMTTSHISVGGRQRHGTEDATFDPADCAQLIVAGKRAHRRPPARWLCHLIFGQARRRPIRRHEPRPHRPLRGSAAKGYVNEGNHGQPEAKSGQCSDFHRGSDLDETS